MKTVSCRTKDNKCWIFDYKGFSFYATRTVIHMLDICEGTFYYLKRKGMLPTWFKTQGTRKKKVNCYSERQVKYLMYLTKLTKSIDYKFLKKWEKDRIRASVSRHWLKIAKQDLKDIYRLSMVDL